MKIVFLGTGTAIPSAEKQNLSLLLDFNKGNNLILVDCNGTPIHNILKFGYSLDNLKNLYITHAHIDHIYALPSLLHGLWLRMDEGIVNYKAEITITALKQTMVIVEGLIDIFNLYKKPNPLKINLESVNPGIIPYFVSFGDYKIEIFNVSHGSIPTFGLRILNPNGKELIYSSDSNISEQIISRISNKTKILIHDCGGGIFGNSSHAGADELAKMLMNNKDIEKLYLVHLLKDDLRSKNIIKKTISKNFNGKIIIPNDGDKLIF